jgi:hypothetical protein
MKTNHSRIALTYLVVTLLLMACGGRGDAPAPASSSTSVCNGPSLTLYSFSVHSLSCLTPNPTLDTNTTIGGYPLFMRYWNDYHSGAKDSATLEYSVTANGALIGFTANSTANGQTYSTKASPGGGIYCYVGGSFGTYPSCASLNIAIDRVNGTISFLTTPVMESSTSAMGTMTGSLTFAPF